MGGPGKLVGACLTDQQRDGLSMIYSFFDVGPSARKGLGTYIILDHILRAARAGLPYVYLGYWVEGSPRMAYKTSFRPLERLGRDGWRRMDEIEFEDAAEDAIVIPTRRSQESPADRRLVLIQLPLSNREGDDDARAEQRSLQRGAHELGRRTQSVFSEQAADLSDLQP